MAAIGTALVAACASAPAPQGAPDIAPEVLIDQNGRVYRTTDGASTSTFTVPADSTFHSLVAAYTALGIEPSAVDPVQHVVSRQHLLLKSRFQGERLSRAFDCGTGQFGPRADEGRILADITSRVAPSGSGSVVTTAIQASLTANDGVSRDPIRCVSNGGIEEKLRRETSLRLGVPNQRNP